MLKRLSPAALPSAEKRGFWSIQGEANQISGDFRAALRSYRFAYRLQKRSDPQSAVRSAQHLGDVHRQVEEFEAAIRWYRIAAQGRDRSSAEALDSKVGIAMALRGLHRYAEAIVAFRKALRGYRAERDVEGETYVLWAIGTTARFAGDLKTARDFLALAIARYRMLRDVSGLAFAKCGLGGTFRMLNAPTQSRRLYAEAEKAFRRIGDAFGVAYSSCGQGNAWRVAGRFDKALPFMNRAVRGYRRLRLSGPLGFVLWSRAQLRLLTAKPALAKLDLDAAERAFRRSNDPRGLVYVDLGRGELERAKGRSGTFFYRRAIRGAKRHRLTLELLHAQVRLGQASPSRYARLGVRIPAYLAGRTLP